MFDIMSLHKMAPYSNYESGAVFNKSKRKAFIEAKTFMTVLLDSTIDGTLQGRTARKRELKRKSDLTNRR